MLHFLELRDIGPVNDLVASFGRRLNLVTGDNGLGKSFLLDVCFWCLTGQWPGGRTAIPDANQKSPKISYDIQSKTKAAKREANYDFKSQSWTRQRGRPPMPGLVIYAAVDGSFAVWDPARNYWRDPNSTKEGDEWPRAFQFPPAAVAGRDQQIPTTIRRDVANGLEENGKVLCNGMIADWNDWYYQRAAKSSPAAFALLEQAINVLSHPQEKIVCGEPEKVFLDDDRRFDFECLPRQTDLISLTFQRKSMRRDA